MSHHITSYRLISYYIIAYRIVCRIVWVHVISHHITSHRITSYEYTLGVNMYGKTHICSCWYILSYTRTLLLKTWPQSIRTHANIMSSSVTAHHDMLWRDMIWCDVLWCGMIGFSVIWYGMIWHVASWYDVPFLVPSVVFASTLQLCLLLHAPLSGLLHAIIVTFSCIVYVALSWYVYVWVSPFCIHQTFTSASGPNHQLSFALFSRALGWPRNKLSR